VDEMTSQGYAASTYTLISKDGYYTTTYRICGSELSPPKQGEKVVLLFHGIGTSGSSWIIQPGNRKL